MLGGGFLLGSLGVYIHQLWLVWLGMGLIGGIASAWLHLPGLDAHQMVSRPARHGHRHGDHGLRRRRDDRLALADLLIKTFRTPDTAGVWQTLAVMGVGYLLFMMAGAFGYRVPPAGWKPEGWTPPAASTNAMIAAGTSTCGTRTRPSSSG